MNILNTQIITITLSIIKVDDGNGRNSRVKFSADVGGRVAPLSPAQRVRCQ